MKKIAITFLAISCLFVPLAASHADPVKIGAHHITMTLANNNTTQTIIAPSSNTNGIIITTAAANWAVGNITFFAIYPDGSAGVLAFSAQSASTSANLSLSLPYPIMLPAGVGLSIEPFGTSFSQVGITYDVLG